MFHFKTARRVTDGGVLAALPVWVAISISFGCAVTLMTVYTLVIG